MEPKAEKEANSLTPSDWMDELSNYGFTTRSVDEVTGVDKLNNFVLHWPGKMYRQITGEDPQQLNGTQLDFLLEYCTGDTRSDTLQMLHFYSRRRLLETGEAFYRTFDLALEKAGLPLSGQEYKEQFVLWEQIRDHNFELRTEEEQAFASRMLQAYRELRSLGYSHFDLCG
jgi:hypothetical protein